MAAVTNRNRDFRDAQRRKRDEFYTSMSVIEDELQHYTRHFYGKTVYCNCDDPRESNFFKYFAQNFEALGIKRLISTCYRSQNPDVFHSASRDSNSAAYIDYTGKPGARELGMEHLEISSLEGDGDFRSAESIDLLRQADIIVTNPPFSLFREYVTQLIEHGKHFLILGNMNAVTYREVFAQFQGDNIWYGPSIRSGDREFRVPDDYPLNAAGSRVDDKGLKYIRVKGVRWFTNLDFDGRKTELALTRRYDPLGFPKYANFDAIEVGKTRNIPMDYGGLMGVPISFIDHYNPDQFEIVGSSRTLGSPMSEIAPKGTYSPGGPRFYLPNGDGTYRRMYDRIVIRHRRRGNLYEKSKGV